MYGGVDVDSGDFVAIGEWKVRWRQTSRKLDMEEKRDEEKLASSYMKQVRLMANMCISFCTLYLNHYLSYHSLSLSLARALTLSLSIYLPLSVPPPLSLSLPI